MSWLLDSPMSVSRWQGWWDRRAQRKTELKVGHRRGDVCQPLRPESRRLVLSGGLSPEGKPVAGRGEGSS